MAITSLSTDRASAQDLLTFSRQHWGIENRLHYVRDTTFQEDRCRVRTQSAPQVLASLRNTSVTLLRHQGFTNLAEGREYFALERAQLIQLIRFGKN